MKRCYVMLLLLGLFSCVEREKKEPLNKLLPQEFERYIRSKVENSPSYRSTVQFLDSVADLYLKEQYKGKVSRWQAELFIKKGRLNSALLKNKDAFDFNNHEINEDLVSNYKQLAQISQAEGLNYKAIYYLNKVAEILLKTDIYEIPPRDKADRLLLIIAYENKMLDHITLANKYIEGALSKAKMYKADSVTFSNIYQVKASLFATKNNINKDSLFYFFYKARDYKTDKIKRDFENNFAYAKAELYYHTNDLDSCLYYMRKIPNQMTDSDLSDEINLLTLYSKKGMMKEADSVLHKINNPPKRQSITQADSLPYLENLIDYYLYKGESGEMKKALNNFLSFHSKYYLQEENKKLQELSTIIDLQQKDLAIKKMKHKVNVFERLLMRKNLIIILVSMILLTVLLIAMYLKNRATKKQLFLENKHIKLQNKTKELEIKLLRSQINPHFIFNTLASIQSKIRLGKNEDSIHYLNSFSKLMRETLESSRDAEITLQKELLIIEKYVELQKLRNDNFSLEVVVSENVKGELDDVYLPALTLQPFVENAILHGFEAIDYRGEIRLNIQIENKKLHITITDNGCGLKLKELDNKYQSHGINIIRERLELLEDKEEETQLSIKNRTDQSGVVVSLEMPIVRSQRL